MVLVLIGSKLVKLINPIDNITRLGVNKVKPKEWLKYSL